MVDQDRFEAHLAAALDRYADEAPRRGGLDALVAQATAGPQRRGLLARLETPGSAPFAAPWSDVGRPGMAIAWLLLAAALLASAIGLALIGGLVRSDELSVAPSPPVNPSTAPVSTTTIPPWATPMPSPTPGLTETLENFGRASPVWGSGFIVERGGDTTQIDWTEPRGVIARTLYTYICRPSCDDPPPKSAMVVHKPARGGPLEVGHGTDIHVTDGSQDGGPSVAGILYRQPGGPATIWWTVDLYFDPEDPGCRDILDENGACVVSNRVWNWHIVPG